MATVIGEDRDSEFQIARSTAIEGYANVEHVLCDLFAELLEIAAAQASIVFFRIVNSRARNSIISDLLQRKHGTKYDVYWHGVPAESGQKRARGLFGFIRSLDDRRNEIVHWHTVQSFDLTPSGFRRRSEELRSVISWYKPESEIQMITTENLDEFIVKCDFVATSIDRFRRFTTDDAMPIDLVEKATWLQIFQQPVTYPPSDTHPLSQSRKAP